MKFASVSEFNEHYKDKIPGMTQTSEDVAILWEATKNIKEYVEIGTMYGISAFAVWTQNPDCNVTTIDIKDYKERRILHQDTKINFINQRSPECAKSWVKPIDTLFIDAGHDYQDILEDFAGWIPFLKEGGNLLFHDYSHSSPGVREFCDKFIVGHSSWEIKTMPKDIMNYPSSILWGVKKCSIGGGK